MKKAVIIFFITFLGLQSFAYSDVPVLIHLKSSDQHDTCGFNLVKLLSENVYKLLKEQNLNLYENPSKKVKMDFSSIEALQLSSQTRFIDCEDIFIYEYWTSNKKESSVTQLGFSFIYTSKSGEKINYGYADLNEWEPHLKKTILMGNLNGPAWFNLSAAIKSRKFEYNLVQFGKEDFKQNPKKSFEIKADMFRSSKKLKSYVGLQNSKYLYYEMIRNKYPTDIENSEVFYSNLESFFNSNKEEFFNFGAKKYFNYLKPNFNIRIQKIVWVEIWEKSENKISKELESIRIYFNDKDFLKIGINELDQFNLFFNFLNLKEFLTKREFEFYLTRINSDEINKTKTKLYEKALNVWLWSQLSEFVNNEL